MPTATPGMCCRSISARTKRSIRASTAASDAGADAAATARRMADTEANSRVNATRGDRTMDLLQRALRAGFDERRLAWSLKESEARPILPRERTAKPPCGFERLVFDPRDEHLVARLALMEAREISK